MAGFYSKMLNDDELNQTKKKTNLHQSNRTNAYKTIDYIEFEIHQPV